MNGLPFILLLADSFLLPLINLSMLISYLIMGNRFSLLLSYQYYIINIYLFFFPIPIEIFVIVPGTILIMLFFSSLKNYT